MMERLTTQLPLWARPDHPVLRHELERAQEQITRTRRLIRAFGVLLLGVLLFGGGYYIATESFDVPAGQNITEGAMAVLFWPLLALQVLLRIGALLFTANAVADEKRRQTWDNLRATQHGAELAMRARWASVFYRMRNLLGIILILRLLLLVGLLYDLTAFQGRYLDLLLNGVEPSLPLVAGALLVAFLLTSGLLLPFTGTGFDAAVGLWVSTRVENRTMSILTQIFLILIRVGLVAALIFGSMQFFDGELAISSNLTAWLLVGGAAAMGDWGLSFLNLSFFGEVWATVPFGIFFGIALLGFAVVQALATDAILHLAVRRAEHAG